MPVRTRRQVTDSGIQQDSGPQRDHKENEIDLGATRTFGVLYSCQAMVLAGQQNGLLALTESVSSAGAFSGDALNLIFRKYLEIESRPELRGMPRLINTHWAAALRSSIITIGVTLPTDSHTKLQLLLFLQSLSCLRSARLREDEPMSAAEQSQFDQLLVQHPGLSMLPFSPKLRHLSLERCWPLRMVAWPFRELQELHVSVQGRTATDLSVLRHLEHLTTIRIEGEDLAPTVHGLQVLEKLRCLHLGNARWPYIDGHRDIVILVPSGLTELHTTGCLPDFGGMEDIQLQVLECSAVRNDHIPEHYALYSSLHKLTALDIGGFSPDDVKLASNLRWLRLWCEYYEDIPKGWDFVASLRKLEHLELVFNEIEEVQPVSSLNNLKCLVLDTAMMTVSRKRVFRVLSSWTALRLRFFQFQAENALHFDHSQALPSLFFQLHQECSAHSHCALHGNIFSC